MFQDHFLDALLTVKENLLTRASFYGGTRAEIEERGSLLVYVLSFMPFWGWNHVKDVLIWFLFSGVPLCYNAIQSVEDGYFKSMVLGIVKFLVLVEFLISSFTFNLITEIILLPAITLIVLLDTVADTRQEFAPVKKLTSFVLAVGGVAFIGFTIAEGIDSYQVLNTVDFIVSIFIPIVFSVLYVPIAYMFAVYTRLYDCRKAFEDFVRKQYGEAMLEKHWLTGEYYISNRAKEYIGRTLGKLLSHYYELIAKRAMELRLYTYELRSDSPAFKVFLNQSPKRSLQSIADRENRALAELIVFLSNSRERTGFLDFLHSIEPLELDPALVQDYLVDIMNKQVPQQLVDEVSTIYEDMSPECVRNRTEVLSLVGNKNVIFHDDEEDNVNSDDEEDGAIM